MNWDTLFSMQQQLDTYILDNQQLSADHVFNKKYLALLVELGELANETRCFKFWSTKEKSKKNVILEEYVDNIHFLLSLGLEKGYAFSEIEVTPFEADVSETAAFNHLYTLCVAFYSDQTKANYLGLFKAYLQLGQLLGFSEHDLKQAYYDKNEVNYERQQTGY